MSYCDTRPVVAVISGGMDPMHVGHLRYIKAARNYVTEEGARAQKLVVGLNSDEWLKRKKGTNFMSYAHRVELVEGYEEVSEIIAFDDSDDTACDLITKVCLKYSTEHYRIIVCNGGDRIEGSVPEEKLKDVYDIEFAYYVGGGKVASSSDLVNKYNAKTKSDT